MNSYFHLEYCLGPFPGLTEDIISQVTQELVSSFGLTKFHSLWEDFSFGEEILESAAAQFDGQSSFEENLEWQDIVRDKICSKLEKAAVQVYLEDSSEATWLILDGKRWIFSGEQSWEGEVGEIASAIKFIRWAGLDQALEKVVV